MKHSSGAANPGSGQPNSLNASQDGYVRMSVAEFLALPLTHFLSGVDDDPARNLVEGGVQASISGYTEWLSFSPPAVTVGWDWRLNFSFGMPRYVRYGNFRSNVMLVDAESGLDLGDEATDVVISVWIDRSGWENSIGKYVTTRYS